MHGKFHTKVNQANNKLASKYDFVYVYRLEALTKSEPDALTTF